jgi:hypothetical protein
MHVTVLCQGPVVTGSRIKASVLALDSEFGFITTSMLDAQCTSMEYKCDAVEAESNVRSVRLEAAMYMKRPCPQAKSIKCPDLYCDAGAWSS